jgi:hypothetical protein
VDDEPLTLAQVHLHIARQNMCRSGQNPAIQVTLRHSTEVG